MSGSRGSRTALIVTVLGTGALLAAAFLSRGKALERKHLHR